MDLSRELESLERWHRFFQLQGNMLSTIRHGNWCIVYLYTKCYMFMEIWCRGLHGKQKLPWNLEEGYGWVSLGTMGIESWYLLLTLLFWSFFIFLHLICSFICLEYGHTTSFVELCCYWFSWFYSCCCFCSFISCLESWKLVGKEEI